MLQLAVRKRLGAGPQAREIALQIEVAQGEVIALSGPSGVGKTTLLRLLAGLDRPDQGSIRFANQLWFDHTRHFQLPTAQRHIGFVFQDYALFPHLTVHENLHYGLRPTGTTAEKNHQKKSKPVARSEIGHWLELMELTTEAHHYPQQLSGGQRQRLALARALIGRPQVLLLDEPLSALDAKLRSDIQQRLALALREHPTTTFLVSHDASEIFRLAQRMVELSPDAPARVGTPAELLLGNLTPGRCTLHATVLALQPNEVMVTAVLSIGHDRITTLINQQEAAALSIGQAVHVELNGTNAVVRAP